MRALLYIGNWVGDFSGQFIILFLLVLMALVWLAARRFTMDRWRVWIPTQVELEETRFQRRYGRRPRAAFGSSVQRWWNQSP